MEHVNDNNQSQAIRILMLLSWALCSLHTMLVYKERRQNSLKSVNIGMV
jgi:hypothetical protein